jgi:hypothetical protein
MSPPRPPRAHRATPDHPVLRVGTACAQRLRAQLGRAAALGTREHPDRKGNVWVEKDGQPTRQLHGSSTPITRATLHG